VSVSLQINKLFTHLCNHSGKYLFILLIVFLIAGLWPFNFTEKNNAVISPAGGLEIARHGTAYTASSAGKHRDLNQFAIYIDITTSSDGLSSFEKIFSYFINQEEMNFILGQWKDGLVPTFRTEKVISGIKIGVGNSLKKEERTVFLISYDGKALRVYQDGSTRNHRETGPTPFSNCDRTYPLVVGTDAHGRSQWKGAIYEAAIFDRGLSPSEIAQLSDPNRSNGTRDQGVGTSAAARQGKKGFGLPASGVGSRKEGTRDTDSGFGR
jgi:hypothetical protein